MRDAMELVNSLTAEHHDLLSMAIKTYEQKMFKYSALAALETQIAGQIVHAEDAPQQLKRLAERE